jgi:hypothetical protein
MHPQQYIRFYDNASGDVNQGANDENKLYYNSSTGLIQGSSQTSYANGTGMHNYIVTQVRKSKP